MRLYGLNTIAQRAIAFPNTFAGPKQLPLNPGARYARKTTPLARNFSRPRRT